MTAFEGNGMSAASGPRPSAGEGAPAAFSTAAPRLDEAEIAALLSTRYGIEGAASAMASERDLTLSIRATDGERYVLKVANAAENVAAIRFQNAALVHLATAAPDLPVSRLVPTRSGEADFFFEAGGGRHLVRLLTFLPGRPLAEARRTAAQAGAIGALLGELARTLRDFGHAAPAGDNLWDMQGAARLLDLTPAIDDAGLRRAVEAILVRFRDEVAPASLRIHRQIVHNDFNPSNLLVAAEDPERLSGILDFGDMVEAPRIFDLAVAAAYHVPADGPPFDPIARLVAAYHAAFPLDAAEIALIPDLVATRHAMTVAISAWRAKRHPENAAYVLRNRAVAVRGITRLVGEPRAAFVAALSAACAGEPAPG
ncbi:phosphotransferase [Jiella sonneratiae]|uniref:Hydroxylysine kinase n=1 Tax=Jiella sonneratiae TaxID=2816856 RepID=A0ABS3J114_9HYPH|nr:phosphotransferase [Jiella sonneratiae]MBO0903361.1 phosphotransferase [Jiella sonneratiae]